MRGKHANASSARHEREEALGRARLAESALATLQRDHELLQQAHARLQQNHTEVLRVHREQIAAAEGPALIQQRAVNDEMRKARDDALADRDRLQHTHEKVVQWLTRRLKADLNLKGAEGLELLGWVIYQGDWHSFVVDPDVHLKESEQDGEAGAQKAVRLARARGHRSYDDPVEFSERIRLRFIDGKIQFIVLDRVNGDDHE